MADNTYIRIDGKRQKYLVDCIDYDYENKCMLYYTFGSSKPYNDKEHKIEIVDLEKES